MSELSNKPKILVVDDLPANITSMKTLLRKVDVEIITAHCGNDALSLAVQHNFAVILLDINMPEMDGFEVASYLKTLDETKNIPIIFVTAVHHDSGSILQGYQAGAVDYVTKPITPEILISKINIFINLWSLKTGLEQEIDLRKSAEQEIEYLAQHDALTHLPNRRQIRSVLDTALDRSRRNAAPFAVLFLDLDGFKKINDEFGHEAGDYILNQVSQRFKTQIRSFDTVGRYGGDEFIILLMDIENSLCLNYKLKQLIATIAQPFQFEGQSLHIGVSIGVATYPAHGENADELLNHADAAMYLAKKEGKNDFRFYSDTLNQQIYRQNLLEKHLRSALKKQELEVYFQPIINVISGKPIGAEALLRWHNETLGQISPEEFIPIAESSGLISEIGVWVLHQVIPVLQRWNNLNIAINASSLQFKNALLFQAIQKAVANQCLDANRLEIEITESLLLEKSDNVRQQMDDICALGAQLSIDDFGTGYSALSYLKQCPVNTVKIDRSFIAEIPHSHESCALVKAIIAMSHALNLKVIAEGIETESQWRFLQQQQCESAQGYFFAKPMPTAKFHQFLENAANLEKV